MGEVKYSGELKYSGTTERTFDLKGDRVIPKFVARVSMQYQDDGVFNIYVDMGHFASIINKTKLDYETFGNRAFMGKFSPTILDEIEPELEVLAEQSATRAKLSNWLECGTDERFKKELKYAVKSAVEELIVG